VAQAESCQLLLKTIKICETFLLINCIKRTQSDNLKTKAGKYFDVSWVTLNIPYTTFFLTKKLTEKKNEN
jgi:hypothetical protein